MRQYLQSLFRFLKEKLERLLTRKISNRLFFSYMGLGLLPLIALSIILISLTQDTLESYVYEKNRETALRASNEILLFIREPLTILQTAALSREAIEMDRFAQTRLINRIKDENPIFRRMFMLNDSGRVNATSEFGEEGVNFSNKTYFIEGAKGQSYFSDVTFTQTRFPVMSIAEPIKRFGQVAGVFVAEIDLKNIWSLVDSIPIGKSGFVFLLDKNGRVIAHPEREKVFDKEDYSTYAFFEALKTNKKLTAPYSPGEAAAVFVYENVPRLNWSVIVQQSYDEAYALARRMQKRVYYFMIGTILIAAVIGIFGVLRFTRPLLTLVNGVRQYADGNLKHKIEMTTQDELAELAQEFNSMSTSLMRSRKKLRRVERLAALSRFASLVSHEVRNPLNAMNINMQILKRNMQKPDIPPEKQIKYLDIISSEIARMNELVTNFLTLARPPELNPTPLDAHVLLKEVLLLHEAQAAEKNIQIAPKLADEAYTILADENQLKQVLHNIVVNAFEAMPDGGTLTVKTEASERKVKKHRQKMVKIAFQDTGEGIPEDILQEVFEFYYTTKRAGSGLGLAIAKQIVESHQGAVYIESDMDSGTSVILELPAQN